MSKKEISHVLDYYFGTVEHGVSITNVGRIAYADIWYEDFKPKSTVRNDLSLILPLVDIQSLERRYSEECLRREFQSIIDEDIEVCVVDKEENTETKVGICVYIEDRLFDKVCSV